MIEFESEEEAKAYARRLLGLKQEYLPKPRKVVYEFPIDRTLEVYNADKISFGIGWSRSEGRKVLYGLWLIEGKEVKRV
jgi:hypothetical protein